METPLRYVKLLPLQGALFATHKNPGRCPGLRASAPSGRVAYMSLLGVLLTWASAPSGRVAYMSLLGVLLTWASAPSGRAAYMSLLGVWNILAKLT